MPKPRKSAAQHKLDGTKPHLGKQQTVSEAHTASAPRMPGHLSSEAKKEWRRVLPLLLQRGSITDGDASALSMYCELFARWLSAKKDVEQNGITLTLSVLDKNGDAVSSKKINPALKVAQDCEKSLRQSLRELGLTPASREKVLRAKPVEEKPLSAYELMTQGDD